MHSKFPSSQRLDRGTGLKYLLTETPTVWQSGGLQWASVSVGLWLYQAEEAKLAYTDRMCRTLVDVCLDICIFMHTHVCIRVYTHVKMVGTSWVGTEWQDWDVFIAWLSCELFVWRYWDGKSKTGESYHSVNVNVYILLRATHAHMHECVRIHVYL